jgi:heme A synthase
MRMLFFAHSGLRYLLLLVGIVALLYFAYAVATKKGDEKLSRILGSSFAGLIDLQVLIGIGMVVMGLYYPALLGHLFMMLGAAVVAHVAMAMAKTAQPPERRNAFRLAGVVVALVLMVAGILSIGREVFGSGSPTLVN